MMAMGQDHECDVCGTSYAWPFTSAYRPHTLNKSCWCRRYRTTMCDCWLVETGFADPERDAAAPDPPRRRLGNPYGYDPPAAMRGARVDYVVYDEISDDRVLSDYYTRALDDIRAEIRRNR